MPGELEMAENAGGIYYDVEMNIQGLLTAQQRVNQRLDLMERSFDSTTRAVGNTERSMSSLSRVAGLLAGALSVQQVAQYADAWATVNNKLSNSLRPSEKLADVTERVFNITQQTRGSLDATASLYARLERATRQYGTSAGDLAKLTTIINQGFVVSGATAQEAENAIIQLSQGLASGALRGEEFNSVNEQGNRLIVALADSMGVSIGQMRNMAAQGKLTTDVVVNGLLSQGSTIGAEFANTTTTISQALQVAGNNITKFFGENSTVKTGAAIFSNAVVTVSENIGILSGALTAVAAVMGSRYVGALTMSAAAKLKSAAAARTLAAEDNLAATATANKAAADLRAATVTKERALDEIRLAEMQKLSAISSANSIAAEDRLSAARVAAAGAVDNYNRALAANRAAQSALSGGAGLASRALDLVGGPAGAAMLAASAILYFSQRAKEARDDANNLADSVNDLSSKFQTMSHTELAASIAKMSQNLPELSDAVADAKKDFDSATSAVQRQQKEIDNWGTNTTRGRQAAEALGGAQDNLAVATLQLERAQNRLSQTQNAINIGRATLNGTMRQGLSLLQRDGQEAGIAAGMMGKLGDMINFAAKAKDKFNSSSLMIERPKDVQDYLDKLQDQVTLQSELNDRKRAQLRAEQDIRKLGGSDADVRLARERAGAEYDAQQAQQAGRKVARAATSDTAKSASTYDAAASALDRQSQAIARLNTGYADGSLELAKYDAVKSLGSQATQQQISEAERNAEAEWKLQKAKEAVAQADRDKQTAQSNFTGLQGQASPVAGVDNQFQQQMEQLNQYATLYPQKIAEVEAVRASIEEQYRQKRSEAMWQEWSQQNAATQAAAAAFEAFGNQASNSLTGIITGSMSASDALSSIGRTILNEVINTFVQMGVQQAKSAIMGATAQNTAIATTTAAQLGSLATTTTASTASAAATTAAWTPAAMVASIGSFGGAVAIGVGALVAAMAVSKGLSGKRKNGGPVNAGGLYQVGEGGKPEIYRASTGKQYMIPGDNGKVISNRNMQSGGNGGMNVQVVINNQVSNAQPQYMGARQQDGDFILDFLITDADTGGPYINTLQSTLGLRRQANGDY